MKSAKKICVLVLEDDEMVRLIVKDYLLESGFDVQESACPVNALKILEKVACDVAIVDMNIPQMSGEIFLEKAKIICPGIQIIIHTGASDYRGSLKMRKMNISQENILVKPVEDMNIFPTLIKQLVQNR